MTANREYSNKYIYKLQNTSINDSKFDLYLHKLNYWYEKMTGGEISTKQLNKLMTSDEKNKIANSPNHWIILKKDNPNFYQNYKYIEDLDKEILQNEKNTLLNIEKINHLKKLLEPINHTNHTTQQKQQKQLSLKTKWEKEIEELKKKNLELEVKYQKLVKENKTMFEEKKNFFEITVLMPTSKKITINVRYNEIELYPRLFKDFFIIILKNPPTELNITPIPQKTGNIIKRLFKPQISN